MGASSSSRVAMVIVRPIRMGLECVGLTEVFHPFVPFQTHPQNDGTNISITLSLSRCVLQEFTGSFFYAFQIMTNWLWVSIEEWHIAAMWQFIFVLVGLWKARSLLKSLVGGYVVFFF